jgi:cell wall-associated NlpC family hydrolase
MTEGLAAVQARIDQLRALVGGSTPAGTVPLGTAWGSSPATGSSATAGTAGTSGTSGSGDFAAKIATLLSGGTGAATGAVTGPVTGPGGSGSGSASGALGTAAVALARGYAGVPYLWGGTDPKKGLDCSGLVQLVYRQLGVSLPRTSQEQQNAGTEVPLAQAQPGDLVFFGEPAHHVGIYAGGGTMIDAPHTGSSVGVHKISGYGRVSHVRRLTSPALSAAAAPSAPAGSPAPPGPYADLFAATGSRYGVDPALLSAVAKAESGYRAKAVSGAGALGLMQLMPGTARSLGVDPLRPDQAVDGAARLLSGYLTAYSGRVDLALAAYNAGPAAVNRFGGVPPYAETQTYVQRVTSYWKALH